METKHTVVSTYQVGLCAPRGRSLLLMNLLRVVYESKAVLISKIDLEVDIGERGGQRTAFQGSGG